VRPQLNKLKGIALDLLFPRWCIGCGREGDFLCPSCLKSLPRIKPPLCPRCGRPQSRAILCSSCAGWRAKIDGIRSPFRFDGVIRQAIHELKYRNLRAVAGLFARLLNDYLIANPVPGEVVVAVPLHPKRLRERGYNQSLLIARELAKFSKRPLIEDCLIRQRHSPPQARTATASERRRNVANVFSCRDRRLKGKAVLLVDDVSTSGATLDACAWALKKAGATTVWGLVLAREI